MKLYKQIVQLSLIAMFGSTISLDGLYTSPDYSKLPKFQFTFTFDQFFKWGILVRR